METKTAVDMHAKAQQSSETVKVAEGGIKVRVTARDKDWVQVTDPKSVDHRLDLQSLPQAGQPPAHSAALPVAVALELGSLPVYSGMLSCFFQGFSSCLLRSICSARAMRLRVPCGMITSSI